MLRIDGERSSGRGKAGCAGASPVAKMQDTNPAPAVLGSLRKPIMVIGQQCCNNLNTVYNSLLIQCHAYVTTTINM